MRRLWLILFVAMLPLQWSSAAVAALCLPDAGPGATRAAAHRHAMRHGAASHAGHAGPPAHDAAAHRLGAHAHAAVVPAHDAAVPAPEPAARAHEPAGDAPEPAAAQAHDDGVATDCGSCCQAASQALPARAVRAQAPAAPQALPEPAVRALPPPMLEGPFRPPRSMPA